MPGITNPNTRERRGREAAARLLAVREAAAGVFLRQGYARAVIEEIARRAGVSVGTVYNCYRGKPALYEAVAREAGTELLAGTRSALAGAGGVAACLTAFARLRLEGAGRHPLFLSLFGSWRGLGIDAELEPVARALAPLHGDYEAAVAAFLRQGMTERVFRAADVRLAAAGVEAVVAAVAGDPRRMPPAEGVRRAHQVTSMLLGMLGRPAAPEPARGDRLCLSRYDFERLKELAAVARTFGRRREAPHLDRLERQLAGAAVLAPCDMPGDRVTMNSRVVLADGAGRERVCRLAFPGDVARDAEGVSVLSPLGAALLGSTLGARIAFREERRTVQRRVARLLYQPEAAGDYHL